MGEIIDRNGPRWSICSEEWLHIGDEIAVLSEQTAHHQDTYGRIIAADAESGLPVVLLILGGRPLREVTLPLGDILGRRVARYADRVPAPIYWDNPLVDLEAEHAESEQDRLLAALQHHDDRVATRRMPRP